MSVCVKTASAFDLIRIKTSGIDELTLDYMFLLFSFFDEDVLHSCKSFALLILICISLVGIQ